MWPLFWLDNAISFCRFKQKFRLIKKLLPMWLRHTRELEHSHLLDWPVIGMLLGQLFHKESSYYKKSNYLRYEKTWLEFYFKTTIKSSGKQQWKRPCIHCFLDEQLRSMSFIPIYFTLIMVIFSDKLERRLISLILMQDTLLSCK